MLTPSAAERVGLSLTIDANVICPVAPDATQNPV